MGAISTLFFPFLLAACAPHFRGIEGQTGPISGAEVATLPPAISLNQSSLSAAYGQTISTIRVTNTGQAIQSCAISPDLPSQTGLAFNAQTCEISGTPTALHAATVYTITAANAAGSATATITISVVARVPALSYGEATGTTGTAGVAMNIAPSLLSANGAPITGCGIKPGSANAGSFPGTLSVNATTCVISGTPTATLAPTSFTLIASNGIGPSEEATVTLTVNAGPVATLAFSTQPGGTVNAGDPLTTQPVIELRDAYGNLVIHSSSLITLTAWLDANCDTLTGLGPLFGSEVEALAGVATFTALSDGSPEAVYIKASDGTHSVCSTGVATFQGGAFSVDNIPTLLPGLKLWLRADSLGPTENSPVSSWTDSSGNGNTATQATAANRPAFRNNVINGKPTVRFDGTDDFLVAAGPSLAGSLSIFTVFRPQTVASEFTLLERGQGGTNHANYQLSWNASAPQLVSGFRNSTDNAWRTHASGTSLSAGTAAFWEVRFDSAANTFKTYSGGTLLGSSTEVAEPDTGGTQSLWIGGARGASPGSLLQGDIAEILVYSSALSNSDRQKLECYLANKYALALDATVNCSALYGAPNAPAGLTATAVSSTQVNLAWTASPTGGITGYQIERCPDANNDGSCDSGMTQIGLAPPNELTYLDWTLAASSKYLYRVRAYTSGGASTYTNTANATTAAATPSLIAHSVMDFSSTQGFANWSYGIYTAGTNFSSASMSWTGADWNGTDGWGTPSVGAFSNHPGCSGSTAVKRWISPFAYPSVTIAGEIRMYPNFCGNGTDNSVTINGVGQYSLSLSAFDIVGSSFAISTSLQSGDILDLASGSRGDCSCDATYFDARIYDTLNPMPVPNVAVPGGLVNYWSFEPSSISGSSLADEAFTSGPQGTLINSPAVVTGRIGKALSFNLGGNSGQSVKIGNGTPNLLSALTLSAWVKTASDGPILSKWGTTGPSDGDQSYLITVDAGTGKFSCGVNGWDGSDLLLSSPDAVTDDQWHLLTCTIKSSGDANEENMRLYVDGSLVATKKVGSNVIRPTTDPIVIGDPSFHGLVDDLRIYGRAITPAEVYRLYQNGSDGNP